MLIVPRLMSAPQLSEAESQSGNLNLQWDAVMENGGQLNGRVACYNPKTNR